MQDMHAAALVGAHRRNLASRWRSALAFVAIAAVAITGLAVLKPADATVSLAGADAAAWPSSWNTYTLLDGTAVKDVQGDESPPTSDLNSGTPCAGSPCLGPQPTVAYASDGTNAFFRFRMSDDNNDATKGGLTASTFIVQIADTTDTVRAVVGVDGKDNTNDYVYVANAAGGVVTPVYTYPFTAGSPSSAGMRWIPDGATGEFFLDIQVPISAITTVSGGAITASTSVKLYYGSSQAANLAVINKDFMIGGAGTVSFANVSVVKLDPPVVTFDSQGGSSVTSQTLDGSTTTATEPTAPTRSGFVFAGWYDDAAPAGTAWDFATAITADTTLYAHWTPAHTVSFDSQGGSAVADQDVVDGGFATQPTAPTRPGHTFNGWFDQATGGTAWNFATQAITGATTIYAQWTQHTYGVTFDSQGGSAVTGQTIGHGDLVLEPTPPTRPGYTLTGWFTTASTGGAQWNFASDTITGARTLYARWTQDTYSVVFDSHGGTAVPGQTVAHGGLVPEPTDPTRPGYTFEGWFDQATGGDEWDFGTDTITAGRTLHAQWTQNTYAVTFDSHGGSAVTGQTIGYGDLATEPTDPTRPGYTFDGWFTQATGGDEWDFTADTITGATTIHAQWTRNSYALTFDSQGGSAVTGQSVLYAATAVEPTAPTRPGYTFDGWWTTASIGGSEWDFGVNTVVGATTLYARWTLNQYAVTFDSHGGSPVTGQNVDHGSTATQPTAPTRSGYTFDGWFTQATGGSAWSFATDTITGATTIHAQWTVLPGLCTIEFDSNGGTAVADQSLTCGDVPTAPTPPTRPGYTFDGWFDQPSGGDEWDFGTDPLPGDITLYAHWTVNTYGVVFNSQGGSAVTGETVAHGGLVTEPSDPTWTGYTFDGWWTTPSVGGFEWDFATDAITGARTLYARWTLNQYAVTFDSHGGSPVTGQNVNHGSTATQPTAPTRSGYTFDGWFTQATGGSAWSFATDTITGATTIHAQWTVLPGLCTIEFDSNGGSVVPDESVTCGDVPTAPTPPTRPGYTFDGWFDQPTGGDEWDFGTDPLPGDTTLYAHWTLLTYAVTFDSHGGSAVAGDTVGHGLTVTQPTAPTRSGYTFDGWFTQASGGSAWNFATDTISSATTIHAQWTALPGLCTIEFDANGGTPVPDQSVTCGDVPTAPTPPTRTGYTFGGWWDQPTGGDEWDFGTDPLPGDTTLYAHWTLNTYQVQFSLNGGTGTAPDQFVGHGALVTAPTAPTMPGASFDGWWTQAVGGSQWSFGTGTITGPVTLHAHWSELSYPVTFDSAGGSAVPAQQVGWNDPVDVPPTPVRDGYTFAGWYVGDAPWSFSAPVLAPLTLTAHWTANLYPVVFEPNNGKASWTRDVTYMSTVEVPAEVRRRGHTFAGWHRGAEMFDFGSPITGPTTLTAWWTVRTFAVSFKTGKAASAVPTQTVRMKDRARRPAKPTRPDFDFGGWFTSKKGGHRYDWSSRVTQDVVLYARWLDRDIDEDGLTDHQETTGSQNPYKRCPTDPSRADTDKDGLTDGREIRGFRMRTRVFAVHRTFRIGFVQTNPCRFDTDKDGLRDGKEVRGTKVARKYTRNWGHPSKFYRTDPTARDTDRDKLTDKQELLGPPRGRYKNLPSNPFDWDTDTGGISDGTEVAAGSNPNDTRSGPRHPRAALPIL